MCLQRTIHACNVIISHVISNTTAKTSAYTALRSCLQCIHIICSFHQKGYEEHNAISAGLKPCLQCIHISRNLQKKCCQEHFRSAGAMLAMGSYRKEITIETLHRALPRRSMHACDVLMSYTSTMETL